MTIRLTVQRERWWNHVTYVADTIDGLVPVIKGNGYGFGRSGLAIAASRLSSVLAVGTVHELDGLLQLEGVAPSTTFIVLTPNLHARVSHLPTDRVVLTIGNDRHLEALRGWNGRVIVKLPSAMRRYGGDMGLVGRAQRSGLRTVGVAIHPPIAGDDDEHVAQITRLLPGIDPSLDVWVSHLAPTTYEQLPTTHRFRLRLGTYLWLGDREAIHLGADVLERRSVRAGDAAGYRQQVVEHDGHLVMIGAGSANGVTTLGDGRSPFHFERRRLDLLEAPHMHTSMAVVADGDPCPGIGDWVDVQRPLTMTTVDELHWV